MAATRIIAVSMLTIGSALLLQLASAQQPGVRRTELQRHDLSVPGREVVQVRVEIDAGVALPVHSHHGEEIAYVLQGTWEFQVEGQQAQTLKAGDVAFVPAGMKHGAKNIGSGTGSVLATYVVEKGKPLVVPAKYAAPRDDQAIIDHIKQLENDRIQDGVGKDVAWVAAATADEYVQIDWNGKVLDKPTILDRIRSSDIQLQSNTLDEINVRVYCDTAVSGMATRKGQWRARTSAPASATPAYT
jgi:quercetin dioxygenase-like cupin family protein